MALVWGDWQLATRGSKSGVGRGEEMGADAVAIAEPGRSVAHENAGGRRVGLDLERHIVIMVRIVPHVRGG